MSNGKRTTEELRRAGVAALYESLGVADAIRFLRLYDPGNGDFTAERAAAIDRGEYDDLVNELVSDALGTVSVRLDRELVGAGAE